MAFPCLNRPKVKEPCNPQYTRTAQRKMELRRRRAEAFSMSSSSSSSSNLHVPPRNKSLDAFRPPPIIVPR
ncbi:hypothetical protein LSM04_002553 [Trypanosoma melophagium]|uniref:uncharacterized protein n=1 Tax=Trypanosoma melophagium TaxID=715481 RepID=UPI00351A7A31|nr:hypothetical protein LSM04_002553 [Trypanosoma melophagium]